jgi:aconitate hydratase
MKTYQDSLGVKSTLSTLAGTVHYYSLDKLAAKGYGDLSRMPVTVRILLESVLRNLDGAVVTEDHLESLIRWRDASQSDARQGEFPFMPSRVLAQDLTGVPAIVDLAVMRDAIVQLGGDPRRINPLIPVDLVIDHSVQVDRYGSPEALEVNAEREFERNRERYEILKWASQAFSNFTVVPPATGICHQVNLEYLAKVVQLSGGPGSRDGEPVAFPDTLVGLDSHTTMVNGLGVLGWGVGGIEAEAAMLGQPVYMPLPQVIGFRMVGRLAPGVTATDLVLTVTQMLREHGVVGRFVEFFGPGLDGLDGLDLPDRATISNMCPEYGATAALFPVDDVTLHYLRTTGRDAAQVDLVERYTRAQGLFRTAGAPEPVYSEVLELDVGTVVPAIAGPRRPQDRIPLDKVKAAFGATVAQSAKGAPAPATPPTGTAVQLDGREATIDHGSVVIAAITSCTNTSNPSVMIGAGLLAKKAVEAGLRMPATVKTSLAPGSKVVRRYLEQSGLMPYLEALGFHLVGFGCTTCIGNSGPLRPEISRAIREKNLTVASVLSGNRNFEGRIHQEIRANYLASPPLVVAYALAGTVAIDLTSEPLGRGKGGQPVYLTDIWPGADEVRALTRETVCPDLFREEYANVYTGNETWNGIRFEGDQLLRYPWDASSTYIHKPPFFDALAGEGAREAPPVAPIRSARVLAMLGDSITTDHISPAGAIAPDGPAARWLEQEGVVRSDFNTFGSRRGNHEVMMRGTFANVRIRNALVPGVEGGHTLYLPAGEQMSIYEAAMRYAQEGTPLIVLGGKDYGMGSSRDWAAKGPMLLGVKAVIAESYERIHRSNLLGMGVLPLQFLEGQSARALGLTGHETFDIEPLTEPGQMLKVVAKGERELAREIAREIAFTVQARIDSAIELDYYRNGGILQAVLLRLAE